MTGGVSRTGDHESRRYVDGPYIESLLSRLSDRDQEIVDSLWHLRVASGIQLERLHFHSLSPYTRARTRRIVLSRLSSWGVIAPLQRTIGGVRGGSSGLVFSLDAAGQRLVHLRHPEVFEHDSRARRPWTPGRMFLHHSLAVSELYVSLTESSRDGSFSIGDYEAEPRSWWPNALGGWLKPDAYIRLETSALVDHWWAEIDRATESLPTLRAKLTTYLDFISQGQLGPNGVTPRILITVPDERRRAAISGLIERLPDPANALFVVTLSHHAVQMLIASLKE